MATLSKKNTGSFEIQFRDENGDRKTVYLGSRKFTERTAGELKEVIERLVLCRTNTMELDRRSLTWLETASAEIRRKLSDVGLIVVPPSHTLKELWDAFLAFKTRHVKESTISLYEAVRSRFDLFFGDGEQIDELTRERMQSWKDHMLDEVEGPTVACYVKQTKTVFNWAKGQGWIEKSPMTGVSVGSFVNKKKDRIVPMTDYRRLLEVCPCKDWRVIIALTRIGGLRCPSEVLQLRWEDVDWDRGCFLVRSPKTEHHEGKEGRTVPIFPELKTELEALFFDPSSEGKEFVINRYRSTKQNLRTTLEKIFNRAKLPMIPKPFDNFRMTRSNEVYNRWGAFKESQWIGHSSRVRADHYLMLTDDDYLEASQWESKTASSNRPKRQKAELFNS